MKVLVIGGGISSERDVSLRSSKSVYQATLNLKLDSEYYDWHGDKEWLNENLKRFNVVLPILHGIGGEDGRIQSMLDACNSKYLGSGIATSELCFNKNLLKNELTKHSILTPASSVVDLDSYTKHALTLNPHVLKPIDGGSSLDNIIMKKPSDKNSEIVEKLFKKHNKMLLEEFIEGTEITVPILDGYDMPVVEIVPPEGGTFDYKNKYNGKTEELIPPSNVTPDAQQISKDIARRIHKLANCRHISRTDIIIVDNKFYVLEINTMPGMTDQSVFPKAAASVGLNFDKLVEHLINLAVEDN